MRASGSGTESDECSFPLVDELWARQDLNLQPTDYESAALTGLSYGPQSGRLPSYR